jgi:outer membrane protein assembly factor BamB
MRTSLYLAALAALLLALPARGDDWAGLGLDDARTRAATETLVSPVFLASLATGSESAASPVAADGILVTAGLDGTVHAYRESDRAILWDASVGGTILGTPLIDHGRVYVPSTYGAMTVLRLADGGTLWSASTGSADQSSPVLSGSRLFLGRGFPQAALTAMDPSSGAVLWNTTLEQVAYSSPAIVGSNVVVGCNSGRYYALDAASGALAWSFLTPNSVGFASPLLDGTSLYLPSGPVLQRVDVDPLQWGSSNWSVTCVDPAPPAGYQGVELASSSPVKAGNTVVFLVRFVYVFDLNNDFQSDQFTVREFVCGVDPVGHTISWQSLLGTMTTTNVNNVPPYALCPTPAVTGTTAVCASSVDPTLRLLAGADGSESAAFPLDAPCLASPIVANARITALTRAGTLYCFEGATPQPAAVTGLTPDSATFVVTPATLSWDPAGAGATYRVRIAGDGEFLMDWDYEFTTASTSIPCPALPTGHVYTWGVRVQNAELAWAPWSTASFTQNIPPNPPGSLTAVPKHGRVDLSWTSSSSPSAVSYQVAYGLTGGPLGGPVNVGNVLSTTVSGLLNGVSYTFEVRAVDAVPDVSTPVTVAATPVSAIHVGGAGFNSIAAALAAALPGETVLLSADTFSISGTVVVPAGVGLQGVSAYDTRVTASAAFPMFTMMDGSQISQISLSDGLVGVLATGNAVTVRNCVIRDMSQFGVEVVGTADIINNTIVNNSVAGVQSSGLAHARNNIVQQNGVGLSGGIVSSYNDVSDGYLVVAPGAGDLQAPVAFQNAAAGDFREQPWQPSLDAGDPSDAYALEPHPHGARINMGAFGNTPLAATSLTDGRRPSGNILGGSCGLLGLEALLVLALLRRRR